MAERPGNVRELENVTERMLLLGDGNNLLPADVPPHVRKESCTPERVEASNPSALPFELPEEGLDLMNFEKQIIEATLERVNGNQSAAARYLRIPRHVLLYRMEKYGIK